MNETQKQVVVVGGGFAGIKTALELSAHPDKFNVTLVSDQPNFRYYPTLYHTATGGLHAQSSIPLNIIFEGKQVTLKQAKATRLDREGKKVVMEDGSELPYDVVVLALGSVGNYFGIPGLPEYSYGIKSIEEVNRFKGHLHQQLSEEGKPDLNYMIVGGGPTGIELAGVLPLYLQHITRSHKVEHPQLNISLLEAAPSLLPRLDAKMGARIQKRLEKLGVATKTGAKVEGETADALTVDGQPTPSHTVVWTAGVANHPFFKDNNFNLNERGKVVVDEHLQAEPGVYVIGDNAATQYSGMAQTALYDAVCLSKNLVREAKGQPMQPYVPKAPITVIPVGKNWAAVQWGNRMLFGRIGWWLRMAADYRAYADYEPWWKAGKQWLTEFSVEEECPVCAKK